MSQPTFKIVIVGGGTAGWLTAGIVAAEHCSEPGSTIEVSLIESPDIKPIGVGEGTWPTMTATLKKIGLRETDFLRECNASFKQGSLFRGWKNGSPEDFYCHPFTLPIDYNNTNLGLFWSNQSTLSANFCDSVCPQGRVAAHGLAPKQISTAEYVGTLAYGYHLDAGRFSTFLHKHCVKNLGVNYIADTVVDIHSADNGYISSIETQENGVIEGDLFIDCTGKEALLIEKHLNVPFVDRNDILFNDSALAAQAPYPTSDSPIASVTISTAKSAGWVWDIGLPTRRGVGYTYSSAHTTDTEAAEVLTQHLAGGKDSPHKKLDFRKISFRPGHRSEFWRKNCVAIGMAAGFIEPLEATALVLIELSASMIAEQLPRDRGTMSTVAKRYNKRLLDHWASIINFLKMHYALSGRNDSDYWRDHRRSTSIPESLKEQLALWEANTPWKFDEPFIGDMFPSASMQYVFFGMDPKARSTHQSGKVLTHALEKGPSLLEENAARTTKLLEILPTNRDLISRISKYGLQKI